MLHMARFRRIFPSEMKAVITEYNTTYAPAKHNHAIRYIVWRPLH